MEEPSRRTRLRRRALVAGAPLLAVAGLALGVAWASSGTAERPGERLDVEPVVDGDPLTTTSPEPSPSVPSESPRPVPAPPPVDVDDDDRDDDRGHDDDPDDDDPDDD